MTEILVLLLTLNMAILSFTVYKMANQIDRLEEELIGRR